MPDREPPIGVINDLDNQRNTTARVAKEIRTPDPRCVVCQSAARANASAAVEVRRKSRLTKPCGKSSEAEVLVESDGMIVFGVNDDCEHGEGTACAQDASHGVGQEETLATSPN